MKPNGRTISLLIFVFLATTNVRAEDAPSYQTTLRSKTISPRTRQVEDRIILKDPAEIFSQVSASEFQYSCGKVAHAASSSNYFRDLPETDESETFVTDPIHICCLPIADSEGIQEVSKSIFYTQIDAMFLHLGGSNSSLVPTASFFLDPTATETPFQKVEDGRFLVVPRITIGMSNPVDLGWELTYFGRNDWQKSAVNDTTDGPQFSSLSSAIQSGEANLLKPVDSLSTIKLIAGFRYFQFNEHLDLLLYSNNLTATSAASNNLFGGQFGARFSRDWKQWNVTVTGKFGVFDNVVTVHESSLAAGTSTTSGLNATSFVTDLGATASYPITQACSFRFGYQFLMLDGIARAAGQIDRSGQVSGVNANDNCILHGPAAGLEFKY